MSLASSVGMVSGIDYNSIITKMQQADSVPIQQLYSKENTLSSQKNSLASINKALLDFKAKAAALSSSDTFMSMAASASDSSILTAATTGTTAGEGNYNVLVRQLAQNHRLASQGVATSDNTSVVTADGKLKFKVGSDTETSIDLTAGMTLQQLRDKINNTDGVKVHASIINDGTASNPYRLVLTSSESGQDNVITFTQNDTSLNLSTNSIEQPVATSTNTFNGKINASGTFTGTSGRNIIMQMTTAGAIGAAKYKVSLDGGITWSADDAYTTSASDIDVTGTAAEGVKVNFSANDTPKDFAVGDRFTIDTFVPQLQKAQDAIIEVDGVRISRSNNTFSDAIDGVTLTAKKVSTDAQTIQVANQNGAVVSRIQDLAGSYNTLVDTIAQQTAYNKTTNKRAPLFGDSGVQAIASQLRQTLTAMAPSNTTYSTLSSIGVTVDSSGHLIVDGSKVTAALKANLADVKHLFVESGVSSNVNVLLSKSSEKTKVGSYMVNVTTSARQAGVTASRALESEGLTADEALTITYDESAITVNLSAGLKLDQVVDRLNTQFRDKSLNIQATSVDGKLKLLSNAYGSTHNISVYSTKDAAAIGQLGIGTAIQKDTGVDVAGMINGVSVTGDGQILKGNLGSDAEGLELKITATSATSATFNLSHGVALGAVQNITSLTDSTTGLFSVRNTSYDTRMKDYDDQIASMQARVDAGGVRMKKQFTDLETKLATLQSQGNSLLSQLASLTSSSS